MKRGTPDHPKTHALAALLGLEKWGAVGVLEALFHFAAQYAKRGDLGRHPNAAIARGIGWSGDADALVAGLVTAGWLDRCRCHRLRVHDWTDHADQTVKRTDEVAKHGFLDCYKDASCLLAVDEQETSQPLPLPLPLPKPTPLPTDVAAPAAPPSSAAVVRIAKAPAAPSWSREACDDWIAAYRGTAPGGRIGKALAPLVKTHGWEAVRPAWRSYLAHTEAEFASSQRFAATFGRWSGVVAAAPRSGKPSVQDRTEANLLAWIEAEEGKRA